MSRRQIEMCAARLEPRESKYFTDMLADADALFRISRRLRLDAWQFYRDATGRERRPLTPTKKAKA